MLNLQEDLDLPSGKNPFKQEFDPMKHIVEIVGLDGDDDDFEEFNPAAALRSLNNIEFRLGMQAEASGK